MAAHDIKSMYGSIAERRERGKAARRIVPRSTLAAWTPPADRPDALGLILAQNPARLQELLPIRHGRMSASAWTYLRGAAAVQASDLSLGPNTGLEVQLCGDAHVLNYGLWATPERNLSFDLRDFDETHPGPFEWDVKRLAASLVVAARENSLGDDIGTKAVASAVHNYRVRMGRYAEMGQMDVWYDHIYLDDLLGFFNDQQRDVVMKRVKSKGRRRTSLGAFNKITAVVDGQRRIVDDPPFLVHVGDPRTDQIVHDVFEAYRSTLQDDRRQLLERFDFVDTARKVVGVGSVGMRVHLLLLQGRDENDPLFLQVKQAVSSVLEPHTRKSRYTNHGARVVHGQRTIQSASDIFLGWTRFDGMDFYVRQFKDMKIIPESAGIAPVLVEFAGACGDVLARAHARSGDPVAIAAYLGQSDKFDSEMGKYGVRYADQTERDHQQLVGAIKAGDVPADAGW